MSELSAEQMVVDYDQMVLDEKSRRPSKQSSNWMSSLGIQCERNLYYLRVKGDERLPLPIKLLKKFRAGDEHEVRAKQNLLTMGYNLIEAQLPVVNSDLDLFGKLDIKISKGGAPVPAEIKSVSPSLFPRIQSDPQYIYTSKFFTRAIAQFNGYLANLHEPWGFLIFVNRDDEDLWPIEHSLNRVMWEEHVEKLKRVNKAIAKMVPPERM